MPAFSFTAPGITPEMELAERETLPKDVWDQVQNEVHGWDAIQQHEITDDDEDDECTEDMDDDDCEISSTGSHHDRSFKSRSALPPIPLEAVDEMMYESCQLPKTQIQDYLDAKEKVPHLVEEESCVEGFLRCEKFSPKDAAKRLAYYWKIRKTLFGPHRAYLPMTLDVDGALGEDRKLFETECITVNPKDDHGRTVLFLDRIKTVPPFGTRDAALRCLFFIIHTLVLEDPLMQINGCVFLMNVKGFDLYRHFDRIMSKHISILLFQCMPMKCRALHVLTGTTDEGVMSLVLPSMKQVMGKDCRLRMTVHSGTDRKMLDTLSIFGIQSRNVSFETYGGDFTSTDFWNWWQYRMYPPPRKSSSSSSTCSNSSCSPSSPTKSTSSRSIGRRKSLTTTKPPTTLSVMKEGGAASSTTAATTASTTTITTGGGGVEDLDHQSMTSEEDSWHTRGVERLHQNHHHHYYHPHGPTLSSSSSSGGRKVQLFMKPPRKVPVLTRSLT